MEMILILTIIATIALLSCTLQLSIKVTPGTHMIAYASTNITGRNQTEDLPKLVFPPTPLSSADQSGDAIVNRTNVLQVGTSTGNYTNETALVTDGPRQIIQGKPTGNYTNETALVTEGPRQNITGQSASLGQIIPPTQPGQSTGGIILEDIANMNITKEEAAKAEQQSNVMLETYFEKIEKENEAASVAATQPNQTTAALREGSSCFEGEILVEVDKNNNICLSPYEISIACNQGGSLFGAPVCSGSAGVSSIQQPGPEVIDETAGQGQQPGSGEEEGQTTPEEEVIEETAGQGQQLGSGEEEVLEEGDAGEQEVIEDFE